LFLNFSTACSPIFLDTADTSSLNAHKIVNCSFENIRTSSDRAAAIIVYDVNQKFNITNCFFRNILSGVNEIRGGTFNCEMNTRSNIGYYNISGNTFIDINTNRSVILLNGTFSSLIFSYNSFYNVSSVNRGGVYLLFELCIFIYFLMF
jgi:hypothetical protein